MLCPCGSEKEYETCCGEIHRGERKAESALELMKSRYSAFVVGNGRYLVDTAVPENRYEADVALIEEHAKQTQWLGLQIVDSSESEETATVEFKAFYKEEENIKVLHEKSRFVKTDGAWFYAEGELYDTKIGRNDPCPCGSGKK
ncbi:MAG: YchJ family protein, partial [Sulfurimonadaceae bacterium]|nr:YchJ family protein [Sulfurimonadaceae bacterium]